MSCLPELIAMASDLVVAGAACVGALVAWKGLGAWRQQLKGSNEYELAKRILKCTYQLRTAITSARNPAMFGSEMPSPPAEEAARMSHKEVRFFGTSGAYTERYRKVQECRNALQSELQEAEALWGEKMIRLCEPLFKLQHELWLVIFLHLKATDPAQDEDSRQSFGKILREKHRDVLYDLSEGVDKPDQFARDLQVAVSVIEKELRKHLVRA